MQQFTLPDCAKPGPYSGLLWLLQNISKDELGKNNDTK